MKRMNILDEILRIAGLAALPVFTIGIILSLLVAYIFGNYDMFKNAISDLGNKAFTPCPEIFNYTFIISGLLFSCFFRSCFITAQQNIPYKEIPITISFILLLISSVGIFFIGVFSNNKHPLFHNISAYITFIGLGVGQLILSILSIKASGAIHLVIPFILTFIVIGIMFAVSTITKDGRTAFWEWMFFLAIIGWSIPLLMPVFKNII